MSNYDHFAPEPDAEYMVHYGAYSKGHNWKIWSRMAGGGVALTALLLALGELGAAFGPLAFVLVLALPLTAKTGLSALPLHKEVGRPGNGIVGLGWRIQDPIGDVFLTALWNLIRRFTSKRF